MSLACYEQPEMMKAVGFEPEPWIAEVTKKRLTVYAEDVQEARGADPRARSAASCTRRRRWRCAVKGRRSAAANRALHEGQPARRVHDDIHGDTVLDCDIVIIGLGAGGATMAAESPRPASK